MTLPSSKARIWCAPLTAALACAAATAAAPAPAHDYPTAARVEYVQECMFRGGRNADLYKCACVIDQLAEKLTYDEFVEAATFARFASLGGEGGGIFRDTQEARERARLYRTLEAAAYQHCGLGARP
ncbi:MAG TPA: hypothetical protein VGI91_08830 [Steroidobacteraceae bacterium]